jgi:hypothetical protein
MKIMNTPRLKITAVAVLTLAAITGLFLTEEQMQQLKTQARQEFEKQTANWEK